MFQGKLGGCDRDLQINNFKAVTQNRNMENENRPLVLDNGNQKKGNRNVCEWTGYAQIDFTAADVSAHLKQDAALYY